MTSPKQTATEAVPGSSAVARDDPASAGRHPRPGRRAPLGGRGAGRGSFVAWTLMAPALALLLVMTVLPAVYVVWYSLRDKTLLGATDRFIGLQNYENMITNNAQWLGFARTAFFVLVAVTLQMLLGMLLAVPLSAQSRSNNIAATILLLPFAVTPVVSALIFKELLNPTTGWLNYYMGQVGLPSDIEWLSNSGTAWLAIIGLDVWQWTPFVALILMAGLQSLPQEPSEAAAIDGANAWQIFRHVSLPQIGPFIAIALVLRTIQAFKTFDSFALLTNGGPGTSTEIINLQVYRLALQSFRIGAASAVAIVFLILLSFLVPLLLRVAGRHADPEEV